MVVLVLVCSHLHSATHGFSSMMMPGKKSIQVKRKVSSRITKADVADNASVSEPWTVLTHKKPQKGWIGYDPKTMRPPPIAADTPHMKLLSWNVNGLRALLKLESFSALELAQREDFDVLCLQETKLQASFGFFELEKQLKFMKCVVCARLLAFVFFTSFTDFAI